MLAADVATTPARGPHSTGAAGRQAIWARLPAGGVAEFGSALGLANAVALVLGMAASLLLARELRQEEFGRVAFWMNAFLVITLVGGCGLTTAVAAEVAGLRGTAESWLVVRRLWGLRLATLLVGVAIVGGAAAWTGWDWPWLVAGAASLAIMLDFLVGMFQGLQRLRTLLVLLVAQPGVYLVLLAGWPPVGADQVLMQLAASYVAPVLLALTLLCSVRIDWIVPRLDRDVFRHVCPSSVAAGAYAITFVQVGFFTVGPLTLGAVGRFREAAVLSVVLALARLVPLIWGATLAAVFFPRLAACHADRDARADLGRWMAQALAVVAVPAALALVAFPGVALRLLFGATYASAADLVVVSSILVVALAAEALLTWTALGVGRPISAVVGSSARLGLLVTAVVAILLATPPSSDTVALVIWAHALAAVIAVLLQAYLIREECDGRLVAGLLLAAGATGAPVAGLGWLAVRAASGLHWSTAVAACTSLVMVAAVAAGVGMAARSERGPRRPGACLWRRRIAASIGDTVE